MFRITLPHLVTWLLIGALFYVTLQYVPIYFYASGFDDFVKDEVKFAPMRESTDKDSLREHIVGGSKQYGVQVNPKDVVIHKTLDRESGIERLAIDVTYAAPLDLHFFTRNLKFHVHADTMY